MSDSHSLSPAGSDPARWPTRAGAALIDLAIFISVCVLPVALLVAGLILCWDEGVDEFKFGGAGISLIVIGGLLGLGALIWAGWLFGYRQGISGLTPGKRRLRIRLTDIGTGEAPGGGKGVGRWLVPILIGGIQGFGTTVQLIDILWPLWDSRNQRLVDKLFQTQVVVGLPETEPVESRDLPASPIS